MARSLLLEYLKENGTGQYTNAANGVTELAISKGLVREGDMGKIAAYRFAQIHVRELMWQLLVQGILTFGQDPINNSWPFYSLTEYGRAVVRESNPQPYDPDGFLSAFRRKAPTAHPVVLAYLEEAVHAFNAGCPMAAAVVLGGASEMAIVDLIGAIRDAIDDPTKKSKFVEATSSRKSITARYEALRGKIDGMIGAGQIDVDMHESTRSDLDGAFNLIRRLRNDAGHPEMLRDVTLDSVFMTLRLFTEYARVVYGLIDRIRARSASSSAGSADSGA